MRLSYILTTLGLSIFITTASYAVTTPEEHPKTLTKSNGDIYTKVKVIKVEPDGLTINHSYGAGKLKFKDLPAPIQKLYGYDPEASSEYTKEKNLKHAKFVKEANTRIDKSKAQADAKKRITERNLEQERRDNAGTWVTTTQYTPQFQSMLDSAIAEAGGRKISGSDKYTGAVYQTGKYKGKTKDQLIQMVKSSYNRKYRGKSTYVQHFVPANKKGQNVALKIASVQVIQSRIEAIKSTLKSGIKSSGTITDTRGNNKYVDIQLTEGDRIELQAELTQLKIKLAGLLQR